MRLPTRPLSDQGWRALIAGVTRHRLVGLLAASVEEEALATREPQRAEVHALHAEAMRKCLILDNDLRTVSVLLGKVGVSHAVLKGPSFAHLDYPAPERRTYGDIDLLVRGEQFDAAVRALEGVGYWRHHREVRAGFDSRFGKGTCLENATGREIDLHRTLVMGAFGLGVDLDDLWANTVPLEIGGRSLRALSPEGRALHASYHAVLGNRTPSLMAARDLAGMLLAPDSEIGFERLLTMAGRWRGRAVVARAIRVAWRELELEDTDLSVWASMFEPSRQDARALRTYTEPNLGYAARQFAAIGFLSSARDRVDFVRALLVPDSQYGGGRHGARSRRLRVGASQIIRLLTPSGLRKRIRWR